MHPSISDQSRHRVLWPYCICVPGLHYNAKLIAHPQTKSAAIIAILDIFVDDEIYVDYGTEYWAQKPTVGEEDDEDDEES